MVRSTTRKPGRPAKKKTAKQPPPLKKERDPDSGSLFPGMKVPKPIEKLARKMKAAEIERKKFAAIEKDAREDLCLMMAKKEFTRFQIELEGDDYEFELDTSAKVKSKKVSHGDDD